MGNRAGCTRAAAPETSCVITSRKPGSPAYWSSRSPAAPQWAPNHYTQLFFLDEAVALAAGHRPCAECRRSDFNAYRRAWTQSHSGATPYAKDIDSKLHRERTNPTRIRRGPRCPTGCSFTPTTAQPLSSTIIWRCSTNEAYCVPQASATHGRPRGSRVRC